MTRYRLSTDPDTGKPYMAVDPEGVFYSTGEVDREVAQKVNLLELAKFSLKMAARQVKCKVAERDDLIRRMYGMMKRARPETISIAGPHADPFDPKYLICCPFCVTADHSNEKILTTLEHEDDCPWFEIIKEAEAYAAGTHDGGTVPEGDGVGAGPACHQDEERAPE